MNEKQEKADLEHAQPAALPASRGKADVHQAFDFKSARFFFDSHRFTYTFLLQGEASSIHFDAQRGEIFYKGHNLRNMTPSEAQAKTLRRMPSLLAQEGQGALAEQYKLCLSKFLPGAG